MEVGIEGADPLDIRLDEIEKTRRLPMSNFDAQTKQKIAEASQTIIDTMKKEFNDALKKFNMEGRIVSLVSECVDKEVEKAKKLL